MWIFCKLFALYLHVSLFNFDCFECGELLVQFNILDVSEISSSQGPIQPNIENCGIANENGIKGVKLMGIGVETKPIEYPWIVAILYNRSLIGGGVLISDKFVLTSVTSFEKFTNRAGYKMSLFRVLIGAHSITEKESYKISCNISKIHIHESYKKTPYEYNFALMEIVCPENKFDSSLYRPICLPKSSVTFQKDMTAIMAGWGQINSARSSASDVSRLLKSNLWFITNTICKTYYADIPIGDSNLCFIYAPIDACVGNDGGPLIYAKGGRHYLVGPILVNQCGNSPSVIGDASKALSWITRTTKIPTA